MAANLSSPSNPSGPSTAPPWRRWVGVALPLAVTAAVVTARPEIARGTFSSAGSALRVGAVVAAWLGFSWLVRRLVTHPAARAALIGVPAAVLLWTWVVPYFQDETVSEALPAVQLPAGAADPAPSAPAEATSGVPTTAAPAVPTTPAPAPAVAAPAVAAPAVAAPAGPVKVTAGQFRGLAGHRGSGEAAIYRQPDGSHFVRLEDFDVSSGPGLVLHLVPGANRDDVGGGVKLGALKGNRGSQNFTVPPGTQLDLPLTILVWCEPFTVAIAGATQSTV
ncbi:MAG: DM13 domain-containing protein [Acidimicrobiales bacterium]